ncbi:MAG: hypothetical protein LBL23_04740 [Coriobacteriales bacterium]|nr:hypothetical protein [Coriobacteriales bacterium]
MNKIFVAKRVTLRHPDISEEDAAKAWANCIKSRPRIGKNPDEYLAIGMDGEGRLIELVVIRDAEGDWLIYHAMTPPTENARRELQMKQRKSL